MENKRTKFNVSLLGENSVGKTSICSVILGRQFNECELSTIGIDSYLVSTNFNGYEYKFKIYDTAGQERYREISSNTINLANGFLLVFAVDNDKTVEELTYWINSIEEKCDVKNKVLI